MAKKENVFDPSKSYVWEQDLKIEIDGIEFDAFMKALQSNLQGNVFQSHVLQYEALKVAQGILKRYVESGEIKERVEELPENVTQNKKKK